MNRLKEKKEEQPKAKAVPNAASKVTRSVVDVLNGNFLSKENAVKHLPYIFFLTFILISYIAYDYYAEKVVKQITQLDKELGELKTEETDIKSELSIDSKQTQVVRKVTELNLGLLVSIEPPQKIVVDQETYETLKEEK